MTARFGIRLLALALPVALLAPAAAHARSLTIGDSTGDAKAVNLAGILLGIDTTDTPPLVDAPAESSVDVVQTTIDHAEKRLTLTVQFRDLVDTEEHSVEFRIFTRKARYDLTAGMSDGRAVAQLSPGRASTVVVDDGGTISVGPDPKPCRTVRARYDLAADTLTASVPTACLGAPKWVQVAAGVSRFKVTPLDDGSVNLAGYIDDAFRGGVSFESLGRSPKVRRG
jgi:hypothetical protein